MRDQEQGQNQGWEQWQGQNQGWEQAPHQVLLCWHCRHHHPPLQVFESFSRNKLSVDVVATSELAYVAWNGNFPGFAEFLVRAPAEVAQGVMTQHYSQSVRVEPATNTLFALVD